MHHCEDISDLFNLESCKTNKVSFALFSAYLDVQKSFLLLTHNATDQLLTLCNLPNSALNFSRH